MAEQKKNLSVEKEKKIQDQRLLQASKRNLLGVNGKIGTVVRYMGQPIILEVDFESSLPGVLYKSNNYLDDPYQETEDYDFGNMTAEQIYQKIPMTNYEPFFPSQEGFNDHEYSNHQLSILGWHFDGLSRGMNLQIQHDDEDKKLIVYYNGRIVFQETAGNLESYVPSEWEEHIEKLYKDGIILNEYYLPAQNLHQNYHKILP